MKNRVLLHACQLSKKFVFHINVEMGGVSQHTCRAIMQKLDQRKNSLNWLQTLDIRVIYIVIPYRIYIFIYLFIIKFYIYYNN